MKLVRRELVERRKEMCTMVAGIIVRRGVGRDGGIVVARGGVVMRQSRVMHLLA